MEGRKCCNCDVILRQWILHLVSFVTKYSAHHESMYRLMVGIDSKLEIGGYRDGYGIGEASKAEVCLPVAFPSIPQQRSFIAANVALES